MLTSLVSLLFLSSCNGIMDERFRTGSGQAPQRYPRYSADDTTVLGSDPQFPTSAPSEECCYDYIFDCEDAPAWNCDTAIQPTVCGTSCNENWKCFCDIDVEGVQVCWQDNICNFAAVCTSDSDCLSDEVCVQTCCDMPRCMKECEKPFFETEKPTYKPTRHPTPTPTDKPTVIPTNKPTKQTKSPSFAPTIENDNTCTCTNDIFWTCGQMPQLCHITPQNQFDCYCVAQVEEEEWDPVDGNACVQDGWCSAAPNCLTDSDCPSGFECIPNTCCSDHPHKCLRCCDDDNDTFSPTNSPIDPQPTPKPTPEPTNKPTPSPTNKPTEKPTPEPTAKPTATPTRKTREPTTRTHYPTTEPTNKPTAKPTLSPTNKPTAEPTPEPTAKPTPTPTDRPTPSPTPEPTDSPVDIHPEPTARPTPTPTRKTRTPTRTPIDINPEPTAKPTRSPISEQTEPPQVCECEEPFQCISGGWFVWPDDARCGEYQDDIYGYLECKCVKPHPEDPVSSQLGLNSVCIREFPDKACVDRILYPFCNSDYSCPTGYHCIQDHCCGNTKSPICAPCCDQPWNTKEWN